MFKNVEEIKELLSIHDEYREGCLNMVASENYASGAVRALADNDFVNRYGCYETLKPEKREYPGNKYINEFELQTQELVGEIFEAKYVDLRPIGGHMAGMSVVLGLMEPGDTVIEVSLENWGHGLVGPMCQISHFNETINVHYMPFKGHIIDVEGLKAQIKELKPKLVIFGGSGTIAPEPIKEFRALADEMGFIIAYDAAHVTGLIAGKVFPNPLNEGADIMFGSTHKSFPGPQGGFVVSNRLDLIEKVGNTLSPSLVTSHHLFRLPPLAASVLEMAQYGEAYAQQVVKNSKAFAHALVDLGFNVLGKDIDYSCTHLILLDLTKENIAEPSVLLENAGILCNYDFSGVSCELRIGTSELTRRGYKEEHMKEIALFFKRIVFDKEDPDKIAEEIAQYTKKHNKLEYCL